MKILYISSSPFFDVDLSLIRHLSKKVELIYLLDLPKHNLRTTALDIKNQINQTGIFKAEVYPELRSFSKYLTNEFYIINRPVSKLLSFESIKLFFKIKSFIKEQKPDIIHYNDFANLGIFSSLLNKNKKLITVHDPIPHLGDDIFMNKLKRSINFSLINKYILLNKKQEQAFKIRYKISDSNVYFSALSVFDYYSENHQFKRKTDLKQIIFFGRLSPYKGIDILLKSFKEVQKTFPDSKLVIAGKGNFDFSIFDLTNVEVINRYLESDELIKLINESSFVVCPYIEATQSGVIMTSYSLKKPVIATNVGGLPEMVEHSITGLLCEPNNIDSLSKSIIKLLKEPELIYDYAHNIEKIYFDKGERSWDKITNDLVSIYKQL